MDLKKPEKYENKKLASETTDDKKFGLFRKFTQNGITKFNWHFNAKTRLELLLEMMKYNYKEDYAQLLSFYNYDTALLSKASELDTVLTKANNGILVHDLRNSWIDNLYLLMGQAYFYKQNYDTAFVTFQYLNYAFSPKEEDGYQIPIGSNAIEGGSAFKVGTKEKTDIVNRAWSTPESRNESLVWQAKTLVGYKKFPEANSLIQVLTLDEHFPERLKPFLAEVQAWYYYSTQQYDSAAYYLEFALPNTVEREEKARWEYLIGQLYELSNKPQEAEKWFGFAMKRTLNPVLEVYARLNQLRQNKENGAAFEKNIQDLIKMARRDQYANYRDIIYYTAAQMEIERDSTDRAKTLLQLATKYTSSKSGADQKSKAFLLLGNLYYNDGEFLNASLSYDSITQLPPKPIIPANVFEERKKSLSVLVQNYQTIVRQDSLQHLATLTEKERYDHVRSLIRAYKRQNGIKEDDLPTGLTTAKANNDLFNNNSKGEWYFNNENLRSQGVIAFQTKWGRRPNVDNWRRSSNISNVANTRRSAADSRAEEQKDNGMNIDALLSRIPLTEEQLKVSNDSIETARFIIGKILTEEIEAFPIALDSLENYVSLYPSNGKTPEAYFLLYYCYYKLGIKNRADQIAQKIRSDYPNSLYETKINNVGKPDPAKVALKELSDKYDEIYLAYLAGDFVKALDLKKGLDTTAGDHVFSPQLLYVEAIHHIKTDQLDYARANLQSIISRNAHNGMTVKAKNLLDVMNRKDEIEAYLNALEIQIPLEEERVVKKYEDPEKDKIEEELEKLRQDSISNAIAKAEKEALEKELAQLRADSISNAIAQAQKDSLEKALAQMRADSIANVTAQKQKDSLEQELAKMLKDSINTAKKDSLEKAIAQMKADSIANAIAEAKKKELEKEIAQMRADSLANAMAQAKKDSLEKAIAQFKADSIENAIAQSKKLELEKALEKKRADSLESAVAQAKLDSLNNIIAKNKADSIQKVREQQRIDSINEANILAAKEKARLDSIQREALRPTLADQRLNKPVLSEDEFTIDVRGKQLVLVVLDQIDQVYVNEARNAFNAFNINEFSTAKLSVHNQILDDNIKFVIVNSFENAGTALDYVERARAEANKSIVPWLPVGKYYFIVVSGDNLNKIKSQDDLKRYVKFLAKVFPQEFETSNP